MLSKKHAALFAAAQAADPLLPAIISGTLSDDETLRSLLERRERFLADESISSSQRVRGSRLFTRAIEHEFLAARRSGAPAVGVLSRLLIDVGSIRAEGMGELNEKGGFEEAEREMGEDAGNGEGPTGIKDDGGEQASEGRGQDEGGNNDEDGKSDSSSDAFDPPPYPTLSATKKHNQKDPTEDIRSSKRTKSGSGAINTSFTASERRNLNEHDNTVHPIPSTATSSILKPTTTPTTKHKTTQISIRTGKTRKCRSASTVPSLMLKLRCNWATWIDSYVDAKTHAGDGTKPEEGISARAREEVVARAKVAVDESGMKERKEKGKGKAGVDGDVDVEVPNGQRTRDEQNI
jgi:hypothetical protein